MKKIYFWVISCMMATLALAQNDYRPMVKEGKLWKGEERDFSSKKFQCDYAISGDTTINGEAYKKCHKLSFRSIGSGQPVWQYIGALREESKKVYAVDNGQTEEELLFDFGLQVGQTVQIGGGRFEKMVLKETGGDGQLKLTDIDTVEGEDGSTLRRFKFQLLEKGATSPEIHYWIEGVGTSNYPFSWNINVASSYTYQLYGCYEQDLPIYVPNTPSGIYQAKEEKATAPLPLLNLHGQRLAGKPRRGIYLQGSHKYMAK